MPDDKMMMLVRTRSDRATEISFKWAEKVKKQFEARDWQVLDIAIDSAVRSEVQESLQNSSAVVFIFYGHGLPDSMIGQDGTAIIDLLNLALLKDRKVYVVSCWTAKELGPNAENISQYYLGYDDEVVVWFRSQYNEYLEACVNKGIIEMINNSTCTIQQARELIINEYSCWIDYFTIGKGVSNPLSVNFAADLRHNRDALARVFGNTNTTLVDE